MRIFLLLALAMCLFSNNYSQGNYEENFLNKTNGVKDLPYKVSTVTKNNQSRIVFIYNSAGEVIEKITQKTWIGNWKNDFKEVYEYDEKGRKIVSTRIVFDDTVGRLENRILTSYTGDDQPLSQLYQTWVNGWVNSAQTAYSYNNNGKLVKKITLTGPYAINMSSELVENIYDANDNLLVSTLKWLENNNWKIITRRINTYDANGNWLTTISYVGQYTVEPKLSSKTGNSYDLFNRLQNDTVWFWSNENWKFSSTNSYTYDERGNIVLKIREWGVGIPENKIKTEFEYNSNNKILAEKRYLYQNNNWILSTRITNTYDSNDSLLTQIEEAGDSMGLTNYRKLSYTYAENRGLTNFLEQSWGSNKWNDVYKIEYLFDNANNCIKGDSYYFSNNQWNPHPADLFFYYNNTQSVYFTNASQVEISYCIPSGILEDQKPINDYVLYQNYPNPFNPNTIIKYNLAKSGFTTIKLYNSLGEEIKTLLNEDKEAGNYQLNLNLSEFPSGVYLYSIISDNFKSSKKMVLIK